MKSITQFKIILLYAVVFIVAVVAQPVRETEATITNFIETQNSFSFDYENVFIYPDFFPSSELPDLTYWSVISDTYYLGSDEYYMTTQHLPDGSFLDVKLDFTTYGGFLTGEEFVTGTNSVAHGIGFEDVAKMTMRVWEGDNNQRYHSGSYSIAHVPVAEVPEPSTLLLLGSGLIGLAGYGRKKFFKK
jgi:hypothetical protein